MPQVKPQDGQLPSAAGESGFRLDPVDGAGLFEFSIRRGVHRLGSSDAADISLRISGVCPEHAVLCVRNHRLVIVDADSQAGTFLNGQRIRRAVAGAGDVVAFGPTRFRVDTAESEDVNRAPESRRAAPDPALTGGFASPSASPSVETSRFAVTGLSAIRRFSEELSRSSEGQQARALQNLHVELSLDGIYLAEIHRAGDLVLLSGAGRLSRDAGEQLCAYWQRRQRHKDRLTWVGDGIAARFVTDADPPRVLIACGPNKYLRRMAERLPTLMTICSVSWPGEEWRPDPVEQGELVFPRGYVRGGSPAMARIHRQIRHLAGSDLPLLLVGETGTGKEMLARTIHLSSLREASPLRPINCAAIPPDLLEAELFGIGDRVATGVAGRAGSFQQAQGGTLFLDEIGEMPPDLQVKLLRVLQELKIEPIGREPIAIDVRLVSATNIDIDQKIADGAFRRDLYYRLAGSVIEVPPLRERIEDLPLMIERFTHRIATQRKKKVQGLSIRALDLLQSHPWPGNVRELKNVLAQLVHLCPEEQVVDGDMVAGCLARRGRPGAKSERSESGHQQADLRPEIEPAGAGNALPTLNLEELERQAVLEALRRSGGRIGKAASKLGISRHSLRRRMDRFAVGPQSLYKT